MKLDFPNIDYWRERVIENPTWIENNKHTLYPEKVSLYEEMYANLLGAMHDKYAISGVFRRGDMLSSIPKDLSVCHFLFLIRCNDIGLRIPIFEEMLDEAYEYVVRAHEESFAESRHGLPTWDDETRKDYQKTWEWIKADRLLTLEYRYYQTKKILTDLGLLVPALTKKQ